MMAIALRMNGSARRTPRTVSSACFNGAVGVIIAWIALAAQPLPQPLMKPKRNCAWRPDN